MKNYKKLELVLFVSVVTAVGWGFQANAAEDDPDHFVSYFPDTSDKANGVDISNASTSSDIHFPLIDENTPVLPPLGGKIPRGGK